MDRDEIRRKVVEIIHEEKTIAENVLESSSTLAEAGIDSLDALNLLFAIEEAFKVSIPDDKARAMRTVDDLVEIIANLRSDDASATG